MGSTTVSARSKAPQSSLKAQFSAVQVLVNASGKNASSTWRRPRKLESVTSLPAVDGSVKSGAVVPTRGPAGEGEGEGEGEVTVTTRAPWLRLGTRNGSRRSGVTTVHNVIAQDSAGNPRARRFEIGMRAVHLSRVPPPRHQRSGRPMAQSVKDRTTGQTAKERTMAHTLPPLPYDYGALEPSIDAQTMQIHHGKHHQAYVNNLNAA